MEASSQLPSFAGNERFDVIGPVGSGGSGVVYEAFDRERSARVALKTLHATSGEAVLSLKNEFRRVQDLRHPNLVQLHELFEDNGQWFFTMDFVPGVDLLSYVRRISDDQEPASGGALEARGKFDETKLRAAFGQLAHGLCALHGAHKVHRDIKPSNVLVDDSGRVVILDFGITGELEDEHETGAGMVGTAHYMAPEQAKGDVSAAPADWYAFGVMLYQALTGELPFSGMAAEVIERKLSETPVPPGEMAADIPADLNELCMTLLAEEPDERPTGAEVLERLAWTADVEAAMVATQTSVFVGRHKEMQALQSALHDMTAGRGVSMLLHGESGVGKSFLVREFTELARKDPRVRAYRGRCYERESVPYKALDGIIDGLCMFLAELDDEQVIPLVPEHASLLRRVFPVIEQVPVFGDLPAPETDGVTPKELRSRVFTALRQLLTNVATRWPTILVVDDLQWADNDSWALLAALTRPPKAPPLLLLGTQRVGTETRRHIRRGGMGGIRLEGDVRHLLLDPLPREDAEQLVARLLGQTSPLNDGIARAIAEEARGHPLFIDELIRRRGAHASQSGAPVKLDDALWQRVERLEPASRKVLELIAISGTPLEQAVTADAAAMDFGHLQTALSALRAGNLVRTSGVHRNDTIETYHDRVRESVQSRLSDDERGAWHGRLARALERTGRADPEALVTHYQGAGDLSRAADYALVAADKARAALAFDHAVKLYRIALALRPQSPAVAHEIGVQIADALVNAGRSSEAARVYLELARSDGSPSGLQLRIRAAEEYLCSGHFEEGEDILREILTSQGLGYPLSPGAIIGSILYNRALLRMRGLSFRRREADKIPAKDLQRVDLLGAAANGLVMTDPLRGVSFLARHTRAALGAGEPERVARALARYSLATGSAGGPGREQTAKQLAVVHELLRTLPPNPFLDAFASAVEGFSHYFVGEWDLATQGLVRAEQTFREQCLGASYELNATRLVLCRNEAFQGDIEGLRSRGPAYLREADEKNDLYGSIGMRANAAYFLALVDDDLALADKELEAAERHLAAKRFQLPHFFCETARVNVALYRGDPVEATARWRSLWRKAKRAPLFPLQVQYISALEQRARAHLAAACASAQPRPELLKAVQADARRLDTTAMPWAKAYASLLRAALACAQRHEAAATMMREATQSLEQGGMHLLAVCARHQLGAMLGGDEGEALTKAATQWMQGRQIRRPERMAAMLVPMRT